MIGLTLAKPKGPQRLVASIEDTLGCVAVIAAGVPGNGPWKLITARYDLIRSAVATLNLGNWLRLEPGAVMMCDAAGFAKLLAAEAERMARASTSLPEPWFLYPQADLETLLKRAALAANVKALTHAAYVAKVEATVQKELLG